MTKVLTKLELAIHILKNIAENGEWKNDLEAFSSCEGWFGSENSLVGMISVLEDEYDELNYRVKQTSAPVIYKMGDHFESEDGVEYILCTPEPNKACLISLEDGDRWTAPVYVVNQICITKEEFSRITCGDVFTKIG